MSKLKIIDLNKQLMASSRETAAKMETLQTSVQSHMATLKRIEADLIKIVRAEAEEKRLREQQETEAQAREIEKAMAATQAEDAAAAVSHTEAPAGEKTNIAAAKAAAEEQAEAPAQSEVKPAERPRKSADSQTGTRTAAFEKDTRPFRQPRDQGPQQSVRRDSSRAQAPFQRVEQRRDSQGRAEQRPDQRPGQRPVARDIQRPAGQGSHAPKKEANTTSAIPGFVQFDKKNVRKNRDDTFNKDTRTRKSKKTLLKEKGAFDAGEDRYRGRKRFKPKPAQTITPIVIDKAVMTTDTISVKSLAEKTGKPVADLLKKLLLLGMMCTINSEVDFDTAHLVCSEFGIKLDLKLDKTAEDVLDEGDQADTEGDMKPRPPIVTVMGHVDHGKTSLLDAIRSTRVTEHEAGGITQHIGAYMIKHGNNDITFLDTPGHEAFTAMRARGAQVTDIAILVVAADDGVMPQTVEAINHAKAANVPVIVAINKIDKADANPTKVMQDLTEYGLVSEEWGGDAIMVPVSAVTKEGIDHLLEMVILVAEVQELKANPNRLAKGTIVEAKLDKGRGPVATVLVQNGTLRVSDMIVAGTAYGRVRAMTDDMGQRVDIASPSQPVEVVGFSEVPVAGDILHAVEQDKLTRQVAEERKDKQKADMLKNLSKVSLDDLFSQVEQGEVKDLNIVIKADVQGSVEAVKQAFEKLSNSEVRVNVIHAAVGAIKAMDVMLASASNAVIIGFNVRPDAMARVEAEKEKVDIKTYRVIYKAIEDIELAIKGLYAPTYKEFVMGHAEVRTIFNVSSIGTIAGCYVIDGKITKNASVRLLRDNVVVFEGAMASLKRFKDDAKEVNQGYECGITLKGFNDVKEGDIIEAFEMQEIER